MSALQTEPIQNGTQQLVELKVKNINTSKNFALLIGCLIIIAIYVVFGLWNNVWTDNDQKAESWTSIIVGTFGLIPILVLYCIFVIMAFSLVREIKFYIVPKI